jgi:CRP/FNR family transcriptional regulator, cyclic AMP receptor protein
MIDLDHLREYSLFAGLSFETLDFVCGLLQRQTWICGQDVVRQGERDDRVYFIQEGRVVVRVDGLMMAELREGEQFGEMHLIDIQARSATVTAVTDTVTLSLSNRDIFALRKRNMEAFIVLVMNCARDISRRLRHTNQRNVELMRPQVDDSD